MHKIIILDGITVPGLFLTLDFPNEVIYQELCADRDVSEAIAGSDIVITNKVKVTREHMQSNPQLKMIAVAATGFNHIDIDAAKELGITVTNVRAYSTQSVAEHTVMMMLTLSHQLIAYHQSVDVGKWQQSPFYSLPGPAYNELLGKTLVIIGKGDTGQAVAKLACAFGMNVLFSERKDATNCRPGYTKFEDALCQADILTLHCPLNDSTLNLIDHDELIQMKKTAFLINIGRGGLVNEQSLADSLRRGDIAGAGFDVLTIEPPINGNPLLQKELGNFILTPHLACRSSEAFQRLTEGLNNNLNAFIAGNPINVV
ncbi:hypothetical protein A9G41_03140 [Gilliamella sp. Nev5-1]|uniref:D-2-hydroxyacid dehydrogenase n=1 Tax=unclassified Gilliamella TaxID=2685620 RepID=UPI00080E352C|nr:D-2-hydroxyacid dehydrogenase [Gilliamella apicola]OCG61144.1 hypothetical protein A9G40_01495 [Gilliamella apicola]OCG71159.1 hypothetical protein A9G41_03140 [Gilliamella apicola]